MIAKVNPLEYDRLVTHLQKLESAWKQGNDLEMVMNLKEIIPDYLSNNSIYEKLDRSR